jgi:hypothetical protein
MNKEILRMQMLAGIITESKYKEKLDEGIISLTPQDESIVKQLVPIYIKALKNRNINNSLTTPIKYKMASGEEAEFIPYVYNIRDNSAAHFDRKDEKNLKDNLIGINYNYYGPAFNGMLEKIWSKFTGDTPEESLLSAIRHEMIHAKDPSANNHRLKSKSDPKDMASYYGGWIEFPAQTGEFFEVIKNRSNRDINQGIENNTLPQVAKNLQFIFQDILDFYSGKEKTFSQETIKWISSGKEGNWFQQFIKNIINLGSEITNLQISPRWEQGNLLNQFFESIELIKKFNPEGYKEFQKDLYVLIQNILEQINKNLPKNQQVQSGGIGSFK